MAAKRSKKSYPDYHEMDYDSYNLLWEMCSAAHEAAVAEMPANTDQTAWATAKPVIGKNGNGEVVIKSQASAKRADIFAELLARVSAPGSFKMKVPEAFADKVVLACRNKSHNIDELLSDTLDKIEAAFPGCADDEIKIASVSGVELDEDGYMKASAEVAPHSFEKLLASAVDGLSLTFRHVGKARNWTGYDKDFEMPLFRALEFGRWVEEPVDMPTIDEDVATFSYWVDHGFTAHTGWQEDWTEYPCESDDVDAAKAFVTLRVLIKTLVELRFTPDRYKPKSWVFLPKEF